MARKKNPRVIRTPEEHRLYVEELDRKQRERSAAGRSDKPPRKRKRKPKNPSKERMYDVDRHARE